MVEVVVDDGFGSSVSLLLDRMIVAIGSIYNYDNG